MSAPDPDELARRYLDLWQDQLAALAADPEAARTMARLLAMAAVGPATALKAMAQAARGEDEERDDSETQPGGAGKRRGSAARAATAATASRLDDGGFARLERRLALIEKRLARLERSLGPKLGRGHRKGRS